MHIYTISKNCLSALQKTGKRFLMMAIVLLSATAAFAQVPANDQPCNATVLTAGTVCTYQTFTNVDAGSTAGIPAPSCGNFTDADVWFQVAIPPSGGVTIDTKNIVGGISDGALAAYSGTCTALTEITCADDGSTNPNMGLVTVSGTPGAIIFIRVWGFGGETGTFGICAKEVPAPPSNDNCGGAISLTVNPDYNCAAVTAGTTVAASPSGTLPTPTCSGSGINDDVWFKFVATGASHRILLNTVSGGTPMTIAVYSGASCTALTQIGCIAGNQLDVFGLTATNTYYVRVFTTSATTTVNATFNICVGTPPPPPANDICSAAVNVPVNPNYSCGTVVAGTTQSATLSPEGPFPSCGFTNTNNDDVWFKFTATNTAHRLSLNNVTPATGMVMVVYSGTCGSFTEFACTTGDLLYLTGLTVNSTYYVRVYTNTSDPTVTANFSICVGTAPPPPANDECTTATPLVTNPTFTCTSSVIGSTAAATQSAITPNPTCGSVGGWNDDVWYSFQATTPFHRITLTNINGDVTSMVMVVYSGTCAGGLTQQNCVAGNQMDLTGLIPGTTYLVRVYTDITTPGLFANFTICVGTPPPPPANDECANAVTLPINPDYNCGQVTAGTTVSAQPSSTLPAPTCNPTGTNDDVWFKFQATGPSHRISLLNVTPANTMAVAVYNGTSCANLTQIACNTTNLFDVTGLTTGNFYWVRVYTTSTVVGTASSFNICVGTPPPPPPNDECTGAIALTANTDANCGITTPGYTFGATQSTGMPNPGCGTANGWNDDVWFSFVATNTNMRVSLQNLSPVGTAMGIATYTGTCGSLSLVVCEPSAISNLYGLTVNQTYYVRIYTDAPSTLINASFNVCLGTIPPPGPGSVCNVSSPFCATSQPSQTSPTGQTSLGQYGCLFTTPNPTWYVLQIANPGTIVININQATPGGTPIDVDYAVWGPFTSVANGCPQIVPTTTVQPPMVSCSYSASASETATITGALTGQFYIMLVTNFNGQPGIITFSPGAGSTGTTNCGIVCNATATNNGPVCPGNPVQLAGSTTIAGASYSWVGPNGYNSAVANPPAFPAPTTPGNHVYTLTVTSGSNTCNATTTVVVGSPAAPVVTSPVTLCQNSTATPLTATGAPGSTLLWYTTATGGTSSTTAPTPTTTTIGSTTYYVSQQTGPGCESPRAAITVNVVAQPAAPGVTSPVTYCQGATPSQLTATGTGLLWYTTATGGTGSATAPTPGTTTVGSTNYYVSQGSGGCESPRSQITVTVNPTPAAPTVTSPVNYCQNAAAVPLTATGTNLLWYTVPTGGTGSATAPTPSTTTPGSTTYYVSQTTGTCQGPRASIVVNVTALPVAPTVSSPVTYCQNTTAVPLTATGTNLLWYTVATGGTGSSTAPTPSTSTVASTNYYVSQTTGGCEGPRATITVNVVAVLAAPTAPSPVTYCQNATAVPLTATGTSLLWYTTSTGGTGSSIAPTPSTATPGNTIYYVSQGAGSCESPRTPVTVVVNATPAAPTATSPVAYCQGATATPLTATGSGLLWYTTATGGTGSSTAPTPSTTTGGSTIYYVSQTITSCEGPRTPITVNVTATPAAPTVTSPVNYCRNATAAPLTATGTNLLWYTTATGGTGSSTAPTPSTATAGSTTYYVSQSTNTCQGPRASITVVVNDLPAAPIATNPAPYCEGNTAAALTATGTGLLWYTTATGGTGSSTAPTPSTATAGTTTYYVSQTSGAGCEGPRTAITVTVIPKLTVNAGNDVTIGIGNQTQLNATATPGANYLWTANVSPIALSSTTILNPIANPVQTTTYTLTVSAAGPCPSVSDNVVVTVFTTCIDVKNAFSPNGDGVNDNWKVYDQFACLSNVSLTVFNRYGSKVYENQRYRNDWYGTYNGKNIPDGTYYAVIEFTLTNGTKQYVRTDLTILR